MHHMILITVEFRWSSRCCGGVHISLLYIIGDQIHNLYLIVFSLIKTLLSHSVSIKKISSVGRLPIYFATSTLHPPLCVFCFASCAFFDNDSCGRAISWLKPCFFILYHMHRWRRLCSNREWIPTLYWWSVELESRSLRRARSLIKVR